MLKIWQHFDKSVCTIVPLYHCTIVPLDHWTIGPLDHCAIVPFDHCAIGPLYHCTIGPLCHCNIVPYHCTIVPLYHCTMGPLDHCAIAPQFYLGTKYGRLHNTPFWTSVDHWPVSLYLQSTNHVIGLGWTIIGLNYIIIIYFNINIGDSHILWIWNISINPKFNLRGIQKYHRINTTEYCPLPKVKSIREVS